MRVEKKQIVSDIGSIIAESAFLYMISYKGLKVKEINELRDNLYKANAKCTVLKNRMIKQAGKANGIDVIAEMDLKGDTAMISGKGDPGAVAKSLSDFAKTYKQVEFKGGYLDGSALSAADVEAISKLPSKEVLQAQLLGTLQAPMSTLVRLFNAKLSSIVYVLDSYKEKVNN